MGPRKNRTYGQTPTLLSGSIASGESRTGLRWLPSALQHSILLILNPTLPSGPQDSPGQPPEASKRRSGRRSRQLTLSRRHARRSSLGFVVKAEHKKNSHLERADRAVLESATELACLQTFSG